VKRENQEQLDAFRQQQEEAERAAKNANPEQAAEIVETTWAVGRKRKKARDEIFGGVKLRKSSTTQKAAPALISEDGVTKSPEPAKVQTLTSESSKVPPPAAPEPAKHADGALSKTPAATALGLVAYSSDEDD
jgi:hypothetical protein